MNQNDTGESLPLLLVHLAWLAVGMTALIVAKMWKIPYLDLAGVGAIGVGLPTFGRGSMQRATGANGRAPEPGRPSSRSG